MKRFFSDFYYITIYFVCKDIRWNDISLSRCDIPLCGIAVDFRERKSFNVLLYP